MKKPMFAAFDQGQKPNIAVLNLAKTPLGVDLVKLVAAMQEWVDNYVAPVWSTPCNLTIVEKEIPAGHWGLVFFDNADVQGALGYHDLTQDGYPLSHIFVETTIQDGQEVSVTASHELIEMLVDPGIQMCAAGPVPKGVRSNSDSVIYAYETADAVEAESFPVQGINMTNFVFPAWFESLWPAGSRNFDYLGSCQKPFEIRPGGYMPVMVNGQWTQVFGSKKAEKNFNPERKPRAKMRAPLKLKKSKPKKAK